MSEPFTGEQGTRKSVIASFRVSHALLFLPPLPEGYVRSQETRT